MERYAPSLTTVLSFTLRHRHLGDWSDKEKTEKDVLRPAPAHSLVDLLSRYDSWLAKKDHAEALGGAYPSDARGVYTALRGMVGQLTSSLDDDAKCELQVDRRERDIPHRLNLGDLLGHHDMMMEVVRRFLIRCPKEAARPLPA